MPDNKKNLSGRDRSQVAGEQGYELYYFARKHRIGADQAREIMKQVGNDRAKLNAAALRLKKKIK